MKIEQIRDIAVDAPNLLIIAADPSTDELFVAYSALAMYGKFEGGVVSRAVTKESFNAAWQAFSSQLMSTVGIDQETGGKFVNGVLDGIQTIGEVLSDKHKKHGKRSKKS
jgi:hypothetical protein